MRGRLRTALMLCGVVALTPGAARAAWYESGGFFGGFPTGVVVNPETGRAYVTNASDGTVTAYDSATESVVATIPTSGTPGLAAVDPVRNRIWVTHQFTNLIAKIDGATNMRIALFPVGIDNFGIGVNPATDRVYIANPRQDTVTVLDGDSHEIVAIVAVGNLPLHLAVNPATNRVYVNNFIGNSMSVIDGATNTVVDTLSLESPYGITVDPQRNKTYVTSSTRDTLFEIDGATNGVERQVQVGDQPNGVAVHPGRGFLFVADSGVSVIDVATFRVVSSVGNVGDSFHVAVDPRVNRAYVTSPNSYHVSILAEDLLAPVTTIATPDLSVLRSFPFERDRITGTVTDDRSGVGSFTVTVTPPDLLSPPPRPAVSCDGARRACTWNIPVPVTPGVYRVTAHGADRAGNVEAPAAAIVIVVVPGI